jgi:hypothetical protein
LRQLTQNFSNSVALRVDAAAAERERIHAGPRRTLKITAVLFLELFARAEHP